MRHKKPDVPAFVGDDLLLDQLSIQTLCSLLRHGYQLDQLRPEDVGSQADPDRYSQNYSDLKVC